MGVSAKFEPAPSHLHNRKWIDEQMYNDVWILSYVHSEPCVPKEANVNTWHNECLLNVTEYIFSIFQALDFSSFFKTLKDSQMVRAPF